jgi:hypothetical protein
MAPVEILKRSGGQCRPEHHAPGGNQQGIDGSKRQRYQDDYGKQQQGCNSIGGRLWLTGSIEGVLLVWSDARLLLH